MSTELEQLRDRTRQNRTARDGDASLESSTDRSRPVLPGASFLPGDRVFDTVTGIEGEVVHGTRENVIVPASEK